MAFSRRNCKPEMEGGTNFVSSVRHFAAIFHLAADVGCWRPELFVFPNVTNCDILDALVSPPRVLRLAEDGDAGAAESPSWKQGGRRDARGSEGRASRLRRRRFLQGRFNVV